MALKIKDKELQALLSEVEQSVTGLLKAETDRLAKADGEDEGGGEDAGGPPADGGSPAGEGSSSADPAEGSASASAPGPADAGGPPAPEGSAPAGDPAMEQGPIDPEALKQEYASLSPEELKIHFLAAKAALAEVMGGDPDAAGSAGGAPPPPGAAGPEASAGAPPMDPGAGAMPPPGAAGPEASAGAPPMEPPPPAMKGEVPADMGKRPANGGTERAAVPDAVKLGKSEDLAKAEAKTKQLEVQLAEQAKQIELLSKAVEITLTKPLRKAVTSVAHVAKSEDAGSKKEWTKAEAQAKLKEVIRNPSLKKSDRERIVSFSVGNIGIEQIKDLLETK